MNKFAIAACVLALALSGCGSLPGGMGALGGGGSSSKVNADELNKRGTKLVLKVGAASMLASAAQIKLLEAAGAEVEAKKLSEVLTDAQAAKDDPEKAKMLTKASNEASALLSQIDFSAQLDSAKAKEAVSLGILNFGGALLMDASALKDAGELSKEISAGGASAALSLKSALQAANFIKDEVPGQVKMLGQASESLTAYAKTNRIELPSKEAIQKIANLDRK